VSISDAPAARLYLRFAELFNARDYDRLGEVLAPHFTDHHPGLVDVSGLGQYRQNLAAVIDALDMRADPEQVLVSGGVFCTTRVRLTGKHLGSFLGLEPTGAALDWYTHEIWRAEGGRFVERWAVDDLIGLLGQTGYPVPAWSQPG
jgi:predicted ester cyclase